VVAALVIVGVGATVLTTVGVAALAVAGVAVAALVAVGTGVGGLVAVGTGVAAEAGICVPCVRNELSSVVFSGCIFAGSALGNGGVVVLALILLACRWACERAAAGMPNVPCFALSAWPCCKNLCRVKLPGEAVKLVYVAACACGGVMGQPLSTSVNRHIDNSKTTQTIRKTSLYGL
jgi:hypothetical protein